MSHESVKEDDGMILYNTLMGVASGTALLLLVLFAAQARRSDRVNAHFSPGAWAWAFLPLGLILVVMGIHMSLTWPLQPVPAAASPHCCRADNIMFGEPSLFFGAILLALGGLLLWFARQAGESGQQAARLVETLRPLGYVGAVAGLTLFPIAFAGAYFGMFIAPPEEPFSSIFRTHNIETWYVVTAYALTGLGGVLAPLGLRWPRLWWLVSVPLVISGLMWLWIGLVSYFGHIALAV
jgi:uncharacterized membrane protein